MPRVVSLAVSLIWLAACGPSAGTLATQPVRPEPHAPPAVQAQLPAGSSSVVQLPQAQIRALILLCRRNGGKLTHVGAGHDVFGPVQEFPLSVTERNLFDPQWRAAVAASSALMTPEQARQAGYVQAAPFNEGVGTHWVKWSLVGQAFDPAHPAMLLFDGIPGRPVRLVGFSYWVGSPQEPVGFGGPNDHWHRHAGLCFTRGGWLLDQQVPTRRACSGYWLNGAHLWMLHAWVVPGLSNIWGRFAPSNPFLCPRIDKDIFPC
jgi:hypothetical protein